ncbi:hypothetical protein [Cohnella soli]|uniref:Uncharacterized protein n=1 Tax=Cohnella soli TaxID=425005 RepID=A0ABW0HTT0_9BACL
MMKKVSIQVSKSPVCFGQAVVEKDGVHIPIFFDVVKSYPLHVIVSGRGKTVKDKDADAYERELLKLLIKHGIPKKLGIVRQVVTQKKRGPKVAI